MERIIDSVLDTDLYKLTMGQAVFHNFPEVGAEFKFINRGKTQFPEGFGRKLQDQVGMMAGVELTEEERKFLNDKCDYLTSDYKDWLSEYRFNPNEVSIKQESGDLSIDIDGPWYRTIYWEVPLMALISEMYFKEAGQEVQQGWEQRCRQKAEIFRLAGAKFADFGTRRRYSYMVHDRVIQVLKKYSSDNFLGTSNVALAKKHDLKPIGTYAHEWVMGSGGVYGVENANEKAMDIWAKEFNGKLSTALTDTFTTEDFLRVYTKERASSFKTLRQDSGNPKVWTEQTTSFIRDILGLNPMDFTALYSDALNTQKVLELLDYSKNKIKVGFGIGTYLTNDVGPRALNMVIKMFYITKPGMLSPIWVVKLSDEPGKISGDRRVVDETIRRLNLPLAA